MRLGAEGANDLVGEAVAIDVTCRSDGEAAQIIGGNAANREAVGAVES